ncbi:hypothetical protein OGM63_11690 [Plectonema radiosum NIES-515]|uniref:Uncharacterized protein n=1 Tax=Plectonema radiosum NIES-515 TaxID=2986073 RepID=A0ABT3AZZ3_9CYAN|nr:hypothetical protein [Plectonema radiosum]MCV3214164.1 hypothetical protein [Plectonema radiosum NIES-515]
MLKNKKLILLIFLLFGFGYFSAMSNLEINDFLKSQVALMPLQAIALIYITYLRLNRTQDKANSYKS